MRYLKRTERLKKKKKKALHQDDKIKYLRCHYHHFTLINVTAIKIFTVYMNVCAYSSMTRPADPKNHSWKVKQENTEEEG